jgi:hypothetical protein
MAAVVLSPPHSHINLAAAVSAVSICMYVAHIFPAAGTERAQRQYS